MRVPLSWLRDYVDIQLTPEQLAERLTLLGMEVKSVQAWGSDWQNVVVGELLAVERHPRADRLSLTKVNVGDGVALDRDELTDDDVLPVGAAPVDRLDLHPKHGQLLG